MKQRLHVCCNFFFLHFCLVFFLRACLFVGPLILQLFVFLVFMRNSLYRDKRFDPPPPPIKNLGFLRENTQPPNFASKRHYHCIASRRSRIETHVTQESCLSHRRQEEEEKASHRQCIQVNQANPQDQLMTQYLSITG